MTSPANSSHSEADAEDRTCIATPQAARLAGKPSAQARSWDVVRAWHVADEDGETLFLPPQMRDASSHRTELLAAPTAAFIQSVRAAAAALPPAPPVGPRAMPLAHTRWQYPTSTRAASGARGNSAPARGRASGPLLLAIGVFALVAAVLAVVATQQAPRSRSLAVAGAVTPPPAAAPASVLELDDPNEPATEPLATAAEEAPPTVAAPQAPAAASRPALAALQARSKPAPAPPAASTAPPKKPTLQEQLDQLGEEQLKR